MKIDLKKRPDENEKQYLWRLCSAKTSGLLDLTWDELTDIFNKELRDDGTELTPDSYRKPYEVAKLWYEQVFSKMIDDEYAKEIQVLKRELQKERVKLQTEKIEYNRWLRENARDELFEEKVIQSIEKNVGYIPLPKAIEVTRNKREGLLNIADVHFGKEFTIYGLFNEVINSYSPEIFYQRMEQIYNETLEYIHKENINKIHVFNLGDSVEGFIRHSQLWSLRYGVIDSATIFGNYMGNWLLRLTENVIVEYHQTDGNHDELRLLDGLKGQHLNESAGKIVSNCIKLINKNNANFTYRENKTGLIYANIAGYNVMGIHGEVKDLATAIKDYAEIYDVRIDYLVGGHKHHSAFVNCGVRKGCISVGSIVGSDDFSMKIRKSADATASFVIFEEGKGKTDEHTFILN